VAHAGQFIGFWAGTEFAAVIDGLARKRGLNRSEYLRAVVQEDALRPVEAERAKESEGD
jgi:hypothetical protein